MDRIDRNLVDEKFLEYSTLDKFKSLLELFNEAKSQCSNKNKVLIFKRNVVIDKIVKTLEEVIKKLDIEDQNEEKLKGECFEAINFNDYIYISTWLIELIEQDFYEHVNSITILKEYLKVLFKYKD